MGQSYVPESGDIVWLQFDPQAGHEQAGHRPAVVVSPASYNGKTGLMLCCLITTQIKGYPFEVVIAGDRSSAVLSDQIKSLDWVARKATYKGKITPDELMIVRNKVSALIGK
ncbi:endoribonuclease MazF [Sulfuriferula nivalis]|uniref:Toxin n=1 Tax=Sulfuriferula nivalis TaxID=2675298 RepID=A0A809S747_9PROT|nr:endoribonuclease MazF [Sulfuriferula nivalis]BBO99512.1 toxin [Sulfuriferula nivalis]